MSTTPLNVHRRSSVHGRPSSSRTRAVTTPTQESSRGYRGTLIDVGRTRQPVFGSRTGPS